MGLNFQPIKEGRRVAPWVRELAGRSGCYIVKEAGIFGEIIYVGESHTGRLKKTLLRHFQHWTGPTKGPTFQVGKVLVAVVKTPAPAAVATQNALIEEFRPRLNQVGKPPGFWESIFSD